MIQKINNLYSDALKGIANHMSIDGTKLTTVLTLARGNTLNGALTIYKLGTRLKNIIIRATSKEEFITKLENIINNERSNNSTLHKNIMASKNRLSSDNEE